ALGRLHLIEAETVVPVGNIGASPQLEVHEPGLLATLVSDQLQTPAVDAGEAVDLHVLMLLRRLRRRLGRLLRARCRVRPRCRLLLALRGLRSARATSGATAGRGAGSGASTGSSATVGVVGTCSSRSSAGRCRRRRGAGSRSSPSASADWLVRGPGAPLRITRSSSSTRSEVSSAAISAQRSSSAAGTRSYVGAGGAGVV